MSCRQIGVEPQRKLKAGLFKPIRQQKYSIIAIKTAAAPVAILSVTLEWQRHESTARCCIQLLLAGQGRAGHPFCSTGR